MQCVRCPVAGGGAAVTGSELKILPLSCSLIAQVGDAY